MPYRTFHHFVLATHYSCFQLIRFCNERFSSKKSCNLSSGKNIALLLDSAHSRPARPLLVWLSAIHHPSELTLKCIMIKIDEAASYISSVVTHWEKSHRHVRSLPNICCKIQTSKSNKTSLIRKGCFIVRLHWRNEFIPTFSGGVKVLCACITVCLERYSICIQVVKLRK